MAGPEDEELLLEDQVEGDEPETDQEDDTEEASDDAEETVLQFGDDEAAPASEERDTGLVRKLRAELRERDKRLAQIERANPPQKIEVGPKPTLESCDYDEERHDAEYDAWKQRKADAEKAEAEAKAAAAKRDAAWKTELAEYERKKSALIVPGKEEAEETAIATLSQTQQAIVVRGADNPAAVIIALGKHPQKLEALSSIDDPVKFAFAVSKLERELKVTTRRKAPEPEGTVKGSAPISAGSDKHLERLEQEAARTGNRTKVIEYKRKLKAQATA